MIACLGIYRLTAFPCDRCSWYDSCLADTTARASCSGICDGEVYTDTTQGEIQHQEAEVEQVKVVYQYRQPPVQLVRDTRRYVKINAHRRLQRGRNQ